MRFEFEFGNLRFFALFNFNVRMIRIFYFIPLVKFNVLISACGDVFINFFLPFSPSFIQLSIILE